MYTYDGEGRRVKKVSAAETTIFVYDASGVLIAEYSGEVASEPRVSYLTTDHLGSPRVTTNERGAVVNRRDFMAFGEEAVSVQRVGGASGNGYEAAGSTRKDYTGYEKDEESGLEFAQARYYNPTHGRFTSVDPLTASASIRDPQTFNRYSYGLNSPYKFTDPLGLLSEYTTGACGERCPNSDGSNGGYTGRDSSFDWAFDWLGEVTGYELNQPDGSKVVNGTVVPPTAGTPPAVMVTSISLLDVDGSVVKTMKACMNPGPGCQTIHDELTDVWEFDTRTDVGPEAIREVFQLKIDFIVIDTRNFDGWESIKVDVPSSSRFVKIELAGNPSVIPATQGTTASVTLTLQSKGKLDEGMNMPMTVNIKTRYREFDIYNIDPSKGTGPDRVKFRYDTFRFKPVWGLNDGHPPRPF